MCVCACVNLYAPCMCNCLRKPEEGLDSLDLQLQVAVSCLIRIQQTGPWSSARAVSFLNSELSLQLHHLRKFGFMRYKLLVFYSLVQLLPFLLNSTLKFYHMCIMLLKNLIMIQKQLDRIFFLSIPIQEHFSFCSWPLQCYFPVFAYCRLSLIKKPSSCFSNMVQLIKPKCTVSRDAASG